MGRKSKADERKREILVHFYEVVKEEGFENASIAKIADRMEVNPSLLIHYFKTKEEMVVDLVDFLLDRYNLDEQAEKLSHVKDIKKRFEFVIDMLLGEQWMEMSDGHHSVFYACYYLTTRYGRILERFQLLYTQFREMVEAEAKIWYDNGVIVYDGPTQVAEYIITLNEGMTYYEGVLMDPTTFGKRSKNLREMAIKTLTTP